MLTHEGVWEAIDRLARQNNMTPSGLARRAGLDPTTFNKSKRFAADGRPRWPSTESIAKILRATSSTAVDLFHVDGRTMPADRSVTIPLIGEARAGGLVADRIDGSGALPATMDQIELLSIAHQPVYAVCVEGESMEPIYQDGTMLLISPEAPVSPGNRVVVKTRDDVFVKILKRETRSHLHLRAANPAHEEMRLSRADVDWIARIIWASQ